MNCKKYDNPVNQAGAGLWISYKNYEPYNTAILNGTILRKIDSELILRFNN